jgi:hypothetical protein
LTYFLAADAPEGATLDASTGEFVWTPTIEQAGVHELTLIVTDSGNPPRGDSQLVKLTVRSGNLPPTDLKLDRLTISENLFAAIVGQLEIDDPDLDDSHTVVVSDARFEVVSGKLRLKTDVSLVRETESTINLSIEVTDSANHQISRTFDLEVEANPFVWKNRITDLDVDRDSVVAPIDALLVINELNEPRIIDALGRLPLARPLSGCSFYDDESDCPYLDTTGDGFASALDALLVINFLNTPVGAGEAAPIRHSLTSQTPSDNRELSISPAASILPSMPGSATSSQLLASPEPTSERTADRYFEELGSVDVLRRLRKP